MSNNFFGTSDGGNAAQDTTGQVSTNAPIPANTVCRATIIEARWDEVTINNESTGEGYIQLNWSVIEPKQFAGREVGQKIRVYALDDKGNMDPKRSDRAKRMLAAIDANAGGGLAKLNGQPEDQDLMRCLMNKTMAIKLKIWISGDNQGNWVDSVAKKVDDLEVATPAPTTNKTAAAPTATPAAKKTAPAAAPAAPKKTAPVAAPTPAPTPEPEEEGEDEDEDIAF